MDTQRATAVLDPSDAGFRQPAMEIFTQIRDSTRRLLDAVPGPTARAVDLQNSLGLYAALAWRTFKIASVEDPFDIVDYMLTPALVETLIELAESKGVPREITADVRAAAKLYENLRKEHAYDHESFIMMLSSLRPKKKSLLDEKFRKNMFQTNRLAWGNQCDVTFICFIVMPDPHNDVCTATVAGHLGYHTLRPGIKELVISNKVAHTEIEHSHEFSISCGFLPEFSSPGLKAESKSDHKGAKIRFPITEIGRQSAIDVFQMFSSNSRFVEDQYVSINLNVTSVAAMLHQDILIPATGEPRKMLAQVFGRNAETYGDEDPIPEDLMPIELSPEYLGSSADVPAADDMPRYSEAVRSVLKRLGWYGRAFDVYRSRLSYPILRSRVSLTVEPPSTITG